MATEAQIQRTARDWSDYAAEPVTVEQITSVLYGFGSELACLRIFAQYQSNGAYHNPRARVGYSENRASWYFSLEMQF
jgi:hypothetical protein